MPERRGFNGEKYASLMRSSTSYYARHDRIRVRRQAVALDMGIDGEVTPPAATDRKCSPGANGSGSRAFNCMQAASNGFTASTDSSMLPRNTRTLLRSAFAGRPSTQRDTPAGRPADCSIALGAQEKASHALRIARAATVNGTSTAIKRLSLGALSPTRSDTGCQPGESPGGKRKLHCQTFSDRRETCRHGAP